jgi:hypothetical protein
MKGAANAAGFIAAIIVIASGFQMALYHAATTYNKGS